MKVSVIIPVYNVAKYIERCLLSVLNQTWQDLEIILVNDSTADDSMDIVGRVVASHIRGGIVKCLIHEKNRGQSAARNTGIRMATGQYFYFLDSDDYLPLNSISTLANHVSIRDYDFVLGNYEITGKSRSIHLMKMKEGAVESNDNILSAYSHDLWPRTVWNMLIRRDFLLNECLFFEEGIIHEDDYWTFLLACKANSAYFVSKVTYYYYTHFHSTTGNPSMWNLQSRVRIIELMYNYILSSDALRSNANVYLTFEKAKAKYMDRILYFSKDGSFHFQSYCVFRKNKYMSAMKALLLFHLGLKLVIQNLHYCFPLHIGYIYFKVFVKLCYYSLIASIKVKHLFNVKSFMI